MIVKVLHWELCLHPSLCLQFVAFSHVSRICNSGADALANKAKSVVGNWVWLGDMPADIALLVYRDIH